MEKSKPAVLQTAQDLRDQQQALDWLNEIGIAFSDGTQSMRVPSSVSVPPKKNVA